MLEQRISNLIADQGMLFAIADDAGRILFRSGVHFHVDDMLSALMEAEPAARRGNFRDGIAGKAHIVSYECSDYGDLVYVMGVPYVQVQAQLFRASNTIILLLMGVSLLASLGIAAIARKILAPMPNRELFFPDSDGNTYGKAALDKTFRIAKAKAGVGIAGAHSPRLYDFRHTFATHRLYQWMREGKDITAMLPYLSAYMGHTQLCDTYYYIHLVPGLFEKMAGFAYSASEQLLPEVNRDE